jgi:hypothetical protein
VIPAITPGVAKGISQMESFAKAVQTVAYFIMLDSQVEKIRLPAL